MSLIFNTLFCLFIITSLTNTIIASQVVAGEQENKPTIAVLDFQSTTGDRSIDAMLSTGTSETMISDLSQVSDLTIVERSRLVDINKEIAYGMTGLVDENTAQKAGQQVGAQYIIIGNWQKVGDLYRVNARLIEVETAQIISAIKETGADVFNLQDNLVEGILNKLNITITQENRIRIRKRDTDSIEAYKEYSLGLRAHDIGDADNVKRHMSKAIEYDPDYAKPKYYLVVDDKTRKDIAWGEGGYMRQKTGLNKTGAYILGSVLSFGLGYGAYYLGNDDPKQGGAIISGAVTTAILLTIDLTIKKTYQVTREGKTLKQVLNDILKERGHQLFRILSDNGTPVENNPNKLLFDVSFVLNPQDPSPNYRWKKVKYILEFKDAIWDAYEYQAN